MVQHSQKVHSFRVSQVGCDQLGAFIPTWSLGRVFSNGKSIERLPELSITVLSGIYASAFCSTLLSYFKEVRPLLKTLPFFSKIDEFGKLEPYSHTTPFEDARLIRNVWDF